jgi:hypothetical protein
MTTPYVDPNIVHVPATGAAPPASWGNTVRDGLEFLVNPPGCVVRRDSDQALAANTQVDVLFTDADLRDTDNFHDTSTNSELIVIPAGLGGWYEVGFFGIVSFVGSEGGIRTVRAVINGSTDVFLDRRRPDGATSVILNGTRPVELAAGSTVKFVVQQTSTSTRQLNPARAWVRFLHL